MNDRKVIGTDTNGNSKIRVTSNYTISLQAATPDDEFSGDSHEVEFKSIFEFIQYINDHGKDMLDEIDNHESEYTLQINFWKNDFIYMPVESHQSTMSMEIDGEFIADEISGDKQALREILDIASKRTDWGQVRK